MAMLALVLAALAGPPGHRHAQAATGIETAAQHDHDRASHAHDHGTVPADADPDAPAARDCGSCTMCCLAALPAAPAMPDRPPLPDFGSIAMPASTGIPALRPAEPPRV